jgi:hypothetical protein
MYNFNLAVDSNEMLIQFIDHLEHIASCIHDAMLNTSWFDGLITTVTGLGLSQVFRAKLTFEFKVLYRKKI